MPDDWSPMSREAALAKLRRVLGATKAEEVTRSTMMRAAITSLDTPSERLRFARALIEAGGVLEALGNSIAVQSILEGGEESGTFQRPQKLAR